MKKNFQLLFWCLSLILILQIPVIAQDASKEVAPPSTVKTDLNLQTQYNATRLDVLFDNGPIVTLPGGGCSGGDASIVETALGLTLYGWGAQQTAGNSMADDFESTADWNIDSLMFYAYQTGATTSTITGVYVQIWDGSPMAGGTVVWGDLTTNLLQRTGLSNIYRALDTAPTSCDRRQQEVVATVGTFLPAGHYWVQWQFTGTASSGPWQPPVTIAGQTTTGDALQYTSSGGWAAALNGVYPNGAPFIVYGTAGPPVGPGQATNPSPADGATDVAIDADASWENPAGATSIEVFFGTTGNMTSVYSGAPVTSFDLGTLDYNTEYSWKVNETDGTGTTNGMTWHFTTMQDPNLVTLFFDDFTGGTALWTIINNGGTCDWEIHDASEYSLPPTAQGNVLAADADACGSGTTINSTAQVTDAIDATGATNVTLIFDNDFNAIASDDSCFVEVSTDGGTTWTIVWEQIGVDLTATTEVVDLSAYDGMTFMLQFRSVQPGWDWWWAIDNVLVQGSSGGSTAFSEDFEGFTAGQQVACQDPTNWTTWSQDPCNATEDAYISDAYAFSGSNSVVIVENNDLVKPLGAQTSGTWYMSMMVYIPSGGSGYFNTLAEFFTTQTWGMEVYFDAGGAGRLLNGTTVNFTWAEDTWQQVMLMVDLDGDQAELFFGTSAPLTSIASWQWSRGGTIPLMLDANDFFGAAATDAMYFDDYYFGQAMPPVIPVEFTTFSAKANDGSVVLNWATATETNNKGFEIQRSNGSEFATIGFVNGNGTSTQSHEYSFVDKTVVPGQYSYRLKQVDFDGSFAYSNVVEVSVVTPRVYSLAQNYPNPFNPTTQINFSLASDSKVSLKIFDVLGQEVATLLNGNLLAGPHSVNFDASRLTSGVYLYRIDATGVDGTNFTSVKKMILTK